MLTFVSSSGRICLVLEKQGSEPETVQKNFKKVVDKRTKLWYSKRAVAETTTKNLENWTVCKTLKILNKWPKVLAMNENIQNKTEKTTVERFKTSQAKFWTGKQTLTWEFDPGSGWTLAACLTHASRTKRSEVFGRKIDWVADGWVTRG